MFLNQHISKSESKVKFKIELENEAIAATYTVSSNLKNILEVIGRSTAPKQSLEYSGRGV